MVSGKSSKIAGYREESIVARAVLRSIAIDKSGTDGYPGVIAGKGTGARFIDEVFVLDFRFVVRLRRAFDLDALGFDLDLGLD